MVGLDAVVAFTDEIERQLARLEELPPPRRAGGCRVDRPRVPQAARSSSTSSSTARRRCRSSSIPNTRRCRRRAASRPWRRPISSIRTCRRARRASRRARRSRPTGCRRTWSSSAASTSAACSHGCAATRRAPTAMRDAIAGIEDVTTQPQPARVLVDRRRAARRSGRPSGLEAGFGVKQLAARIDLQIRRVAEGGAKVADRLRREVLYYVAISAPVGPAGPGRAARVQAVRADPVRRGARRPTSSAAAAAARSARAARRRQGRVAQGRLGPRGEPAEAQADAGLGAHQGRRDQARRADEAHRRAGRAAGQDAGVRRLRAGGDGVRDRAAARRERVRELREPGAGLPAARSTRCSRGSTPRARAARRRPAARRCSTR